MSDRLSRKEIKRDEFREALGRGFTYVTSHTRMLIYIAVAVLVVVLMVVGLWTYRNQQADKAALALDRAMEIYRADINAEAPAPDDPDRPLFADEASRRARARELFAEVRDDFGGSAAAVATAYLARFAAQDGNLAEARQLWEEAAEEIDDRLLAAEIQLNLLKLDLAEGKAATVAQRLESMLEQAERPMPEDMILFQLAEAREGLGETEEALAAYQRIVDEFPASPYSAPARQKVTALGDA